MAVVIASCNINELETDNIDFPNYKPEVAVPLGEVTYSVKDLIDEINDSTIAIEESNSLLLSVIYRDTSFFENNDNFLIVNDVTNASNIMPNITLPPSPIDTTINISQPFEFEFQPEDEEKVDSVFYSMGNIRLEVTSTFQSDITFELKVNDFTEVSTGDTLTFSGVIDASGTAFFDRDLVGFMTKFQREAGVNLFAANFEASLDVKVGGSVNPEDFLSLQLLITDPDFSSIFGDFGREAFSVQDQSIDLDFFDDIDEFGIEFNSPEVRIRIENSFGVVLGLSFDGLIASNSNGTELALMGAINDTLQRVRAPTVAGESINTTISINNENSNLREMLNLSPTLISLPVSGKPNFEIADGESALNFLTDSSFVKTIIEVAMPLDVKLSGFTRTFDISVDGVDFDEADTVRLRIRTINDLPFTGSIELHMLDIDSTVIYQVPQSIILQSPEVTSTGKTVEAFDNTEDIVLDSEGVIALAEATELGVILRVDSFEASDGRFVQIFSDYKLVIKISALGNLNIEL